MINVELANLEIGVPPPILPPLENSLRVAKRIDEMGYHAMWYPDHLMGWIPESIWTPDIIPVAMFQPSPHIFFDTFSLIAAHASQTQRIKLGTAVTESIRRHPVILAQTALTLDHLTKGRFILGMGAGEAENIIPYGMSFKEPVGRLEESLRIIRKFWENPGKALSFDGKYWTMKNAVLALEPYKKDHPPPILVGAHGPRMLRITGELADGWIPTMLSVKDYAEKLKVIHAVMGKAERDPQKFIPAMWALTILAEEHEACHKLFNTPMAKAWALISPSYLFEQAGMNHPLALYLGKTNINPLIDYIPTNYDRNAALKMLDLINPEVMEAVFLHGTRNDIIKHLEEYYRVGLRHIIIWNITGMIDPTKYRMSLSILLELLDYIKGK
ncbi:MAG: LLM class flavin-dependent oxidoreductase [Candidatus Heimdallarchaeota archaeon]